MNIINDINWRIRIKNKSFWLAIVPALMLAAQRISALFGVTFTLSDKQDLLLGVINAIFIVLALIGVVSDPTVEGLQDSKRAMTYDKPAPKA